MVSSATCNNDATTPPKLHHRSSDGFEKVTKKIQKVETLVGAATDTKEIAKLKRKKEKYEHELEILHPPEGDEEADKEAKRHPKLIRKKIKKVKQLLLEINEEEDPKKYHKLQDKQKQYQAELDQFHEKLKNQARGSVRVHVVGPKKSTSKLVDDVFKKSVSARYEGNTMAPINENKVETTRKSDIATRKASTRTKIKKVKTEAVAARRIHRIPAGYEPPIYKKNAYECKLLKDALLQSFVFKSIHDNGKAMEQLVQAFQPTKPFPIGTPILNQGDDNVDEDGDQSFFIIRQGSVDYEVNDKVVGHGQVGQFFGELALLYDSPRAATVRAAASGGTKLWKVDQTTFRYVLMNRSAAIQRWKAAVKAVIAMNRFVGSNTATTLGCLDALEQSTMLEDSSRNKIAESLASLPEYSLMEDDKVPATVAIGPGSFSSWKNLSERFTSYVDTSLDSSTHTNTPQVYANFLQKYANERKKTRTSFEDQQVGLDDLEQDEVLGEGQFGQVWAVHCKNTIEDAHMIDREYALKIQSKDDEIRAESSVDMIRRECQVLHDLIHPNIVEFVHSFEDDENIYLVMSVIAGVELWDVLHREDPATGDWYSGMSEDDARFYAFIMADTLNFMHKQKICYRDLKPENIMISKNDGYPIYVDFGFAKYIPDGITYTFCGTPNYACPELIQNEGHGFAVDHWALGVVIYELVSGDNPFWYDGLSNLELLELITSADPVPLEDGYSSEVKDLIDQLLIKNPKKRLGSLKKGGSEITSHPWFAGIDREAALQRQLEAPGLPSAT